MVILRSKGKIYIYVKLFTEDTNWGYSLGEVCDIYCFVIYWLQPVTADTFQYLFFRNG